MIENALLHGILYSEKPNQVLTIRDGRITGKSYGLSNVRTRLALFGAGSDGLEIHAKEGVGTSVTLRFPVKYEEPNN